MWICALAVLAYSARPRQGQKLITAINFKQIINFVYISCIFLLTFPLALPALKKKNDLSCYLTLLLVFPYVLPASFLSNYAQQFEINCYQLLKIICSDIIWGDFSFQQRLIRLVLHNHLDKKIFHWVCKRQTKKGNWQLNYISSKFLSFQWLRQP